MSPLFRRLGVLTRSAERLLTFLQNADSAQLLFSGYAFYAVAGGVVFCLPWGRPTRIADWLGQLCESVDDASTTGLVTVATCEPASFPPDCLANVLAGIRELGDTCAWRVQLTEVPSSSPVRDTMLSTANRTPVGWTDMRRSDTSSAGKRFPPLAGCRIARLRSF